MGAIGSAAISRRRYVVGNWKMNGSRAKLAGLTAVSQAAARNKSVAVSLALPATLIGPASAKYRRIAIGGQDIHHHDCGAFTGSLSATMLKEAGAAFTIVGHSECRRDHSEADDDVRCKAEAARRAGLDVILCIGESADARAAGKAAKTVLRQLAGCLPDGADGSWLTIAYEPIWSIGTGLVPTAADIAEMHRTLRHACATRVKPAGETIRLLYGGSVTPGNAPRLLSIPDVNGVLVGRASLSAATFASIIEAAGTIRNLPAA